MLITFLFLDGKTCCGAHLNRLIETISMSTHNMCFRREIWKTEILILISSRVLVDYYVSTGRNYEVSGAWSPNSRDIVIKAIDLNYPQRCRKWASSMNVLSPSRYMPSDYVQAVYLRNICSSCRKHVESGYLYYKAVSLNVEKVMRQSV